MFRIYYFLLLVICEQILLFVVICSGDITFFVLICSGDIKLFVVTCRDNWRETLYIKRAGKKEIKQVRKREQAGTWERKEMQ